MESSSGRCLLAVVCSILVAGCWPDAERSNPLDPLSEGFKNEGSLSGRVGDQAFQPVMGALVHLESAADGGSITQATDRLGGYQFAALPAASYKLAIEKDGFVGMVDTIEVLAGRNVTLPEIRLNALPVVTGGHARTVHISRWWPEDDLYLLDLRVLVEDPDERPGVAAAWLTISDPEWDLLLRPGALPEEFVATIPADSLPAGSVHTLMGQPLLVRIRDRDGNVVLRQIPAPARVIDYTPVAVAPEGLEMLDDPQPVLQWFPASLPFDHYYRIQVVRDEVNSDVLIQEYSDIPRDSTTLRLQSPLGTGSYYWTVSVVDSFGNMSRSKEAGFRIN